MQSHLYFWRDRRTKSITSFPAKTASIIYGTVCTVLVFQDSFFGTLCILVYQDIFGTVCVPVFQDIFGTVCILVYLDIFGTVCTCVSGLVVEWLWPASPSNRHSPGIARAARRKKLATNNRKTPLPAQKVVTPLTLYLCGGKNLCFLSLPFAIFDLVHVHCADHLISFLI